MNILKSYPLWLFIISFIVMAAERVKPWRKNQKLLRKEFFQDIIWLVFNGVISGFIFAIAFDRIYFIFNTLFHTLFSIPPGEVMFIHHLPFPVQVTLFLCVADFLEWCIHNLLHRVSFLWKFHRVHHSITIMDWIGNFRFHWFEIFVYNILKYLPLSILGANSDAIFIVAIISTFIGHLNHSNLNISWGRLRYILNSPRMHIWHHEKAVRQIHPQWEHNKGKSRNRAGVNFGVVLSLWDWLFRTAYMPSEPRAPEELGFTGQERVSGHFLMRFFLPFLDKK